MSAETFIDAVKAHVAPRRGLVREHFTIAFSVVDGRAFTVDTKDPKVIDRRYRAGCDLAILCNTQTLDDIAAGVFDPHRPAARHLFRWGGDAAIFERLRALLAGGQSILATRAAR